MRPCTKLEQDRREMQLPDRVTRGRTLVSELPKRRTDEDAQALIGRANDRGAPPITHSHPLDRAREPAACLTC